MLNKLESYGPHQQIGDYTVITINDPRTALPEDLQTALATETLGLVKTTFKRQAIAEAEIIPSALGEANRGKVLGVVLNQDHKLVSLAAGQLLNTHGEPVSFSGDFCLHISTAHTLPETVQNPSIFLISRIFESFREHPRYLSAFTQSPRVYEYARRLSRKRIIPNVSEGPGEYLSEAYQRALAVFNFSGRIENSVFRNKVRGNFYSDTQLAHSPEINSWWQNTLNVRPENGDLLFLFADFKR